MPKNILVVDDVVMNRKLIKAILSRAVAGIDIIEAEDGFKALEIIKEGNVSAVILDIMMPGKDGIEVLTEIKVDNKTKSLPVIMCSALHEIESVEKALSLGALDYFTKPLSEEQMRITLPLKVRNALEYYDNKNEIIRFYEHIKDEMQLAEQLQKALISEHTNYTDVEILGKYMPCEEVGGDIFCSKQVGEKTWFMIADIAGHGISAAMVSTMLNVIFSINVELCNMPDELLKRINATLFEVFGGSKYGLISAFAGYISKDILCYVNAGHPYPIFYQRKSNRIRPLSVNGFLLGMFENCEFSVCSEEIVEGDALLLYTDGLYDKGELTGYASWNKIAGYCEDNAHKLASDKDLFLGNMIEYFLSCGNSSFLDDVAVMLITKK